MALTAAEYCYLVGFLAGCVIRRVYARRRPRAAVIAGRRTVADVSAVVLNSVGMFLLPPLCLATNWLRSADYRLPCGQELVSTAAGSAAFVLSLWLLRRSLVDLGEAWSVFPSVRSGQRLVTSGIYSRIRHPMYASHLAWALGQALLLHNWVAGPFMLLAMVPFYLIRVPQEEGLMREHFGAQYEAYARRTGRILPPLARPK